MAYDEKLASRVREILREAHDVAEKKMFGGITFMIHGHMACGIAGDDLMLRIGEESYEDALKKPNVRPMDFTGRPMRGMVFVGPGGLKSRDALAAWVEKAATYARALPEKKPKKHPAKSRKSANLRVRP
jgi:TfoX/Sxy family transcriptional regulator of competence genes